MKKNIHGFTIIELLITVAIAGILGSIAVPAFRDTIANNARKSESRDLYIDLMVARTEAIKRAVTVVVCSNDNGRAAACGGSWDRGWVVFMDANNDGQFQDSDILRSHEALRINKVVSTIGDSYSFEPTGFGEESGALVFCDHKSNATAKGILISSVGRAKMSNTDALGNGWAICPAGW